MSLAFWVPRAIPGTKKVQRTTRVQRRTKWRACQYCYWHPGEIWWWYRPQSLPLAGMVVVDRVPANVTVEETNERHCCHCEVSCGHSIVVFPDSDQVPVHREFLPSSCPDPWDWSIHVDFVVVVVECVVETAWQIRVPILPRLVQRTCPWSDPWKKTLLDSCWPRWWGVEPWFGCCYSYLYYRDDFVRHRVPFPSHCHCVKYYWYSARDGLHHLQWLWWLD